MSVPYETAPESAESPETPQEFLARLLGRALNSFDLSDALLRRLHTALAHDSSLHSAHHSAGLHRLTYRHTWLLSDGGTVTLWELVHNTAPATAGRDTHALNAQDTHDATRHHTDDTTAHDTTAHDTGAPVPPAAPAAEPGPVQGRPEGDRRRQERSPHEHPWMERSPWAEGSRQDHHACCRQHELYADEQQLRAATARLPLPLDEPDVLDLPFTLPLPPMPLPRHVYVPDNSSDHARRLLRRAENSDRPGSDTLRLLGAAFAHQITQAFGRPAPGAAARLDFSLYEHAFLLADGREVSLWEVEHTATPDGRHMCEVYTTEGAARRAMELRASRATRTN